MGLVKKWCPMIVFMGIYASTNFIGLMLLLFGPESYWKLSYGFTGLTLPDVYADDLLRILLLAIGAPILLIVGYVIGLRLQRLIKVEPSILPDKRRELFTLGAEISFWALSVMALFQLLSVVGIDSLGNWFVYDKFIETRVKIMSEMPQVFFCIIYSMIPLCLAITVNKNLLGKQWIYLGVKIFVLIILNVYLFQKRPLGNAILLISFSVFIYYFMGGMPRKVLSKRLIPSVAAVVAILYIIYTVGIYITSVGEMSEIPISATQQVDLDSLKGEKPGQSDSSTGSSSIEDSREPFKKFELESQTLYVSRFTFVNAMAFWGMLNRTAYSSIVYPVIFPEYLDYYPLDLGIGNMPDDAIVAYQIMNPQNPEGSAAAPFFTVLYSQGGLLVAFIGSFLVGLCFALVWGMILRMRKPGVATSALGALELLFAVLMAMASGRDSLLSSYGVIWPVFWLLFAYGVYWILFHCRRKKGAHTRICMMVTSGVVNDSRVIREANLAAESGFETLMLGRLVPELGEPDPNWKFSCKRIAIPRAAQSGVMGKIAERVRIGLAFTMNAVRFRPDLIHCNDFDTLPFGYLAAIICDSALIYDSHELWSENELAGRSALGKRLVKWIEGFLARRCDGVISVSNAAGVWLRELYDLKNLIVVTNCPKIGAVEQQPKSERFELLCHGMFAPDRGYEELIDCAALVEPHDIQVRMRGYGVRTQEYQERATKTGQMNIFFSEKVPSDQVCSAASASHVGIALTRPVSKSYELTVSNKLFEYLAAGLPVILSDVPEHRMLNERYHFGMILDRITPEALAEAAIRLKEDPALYQELQENAMLASRDLCFEKEGEKLISLYHVAMQNRTMEDQEYETSFA